MMRRQKPDTIGSLSSTAGHVIATVSGFVVFMSNAPRYLSFGSGPATSYLIHIDRTR